MMNGSSDSLSQIDLLVDEFLERQRRGENPRVEEYIARYPALADEIADVFPTLAVMENIAPVSHDIKLETAGTHNAQSARQPECVGDYRILREVGRGGMGIVYEAEQQSLGRRVAVKVLPTQVAGDQRSRLRFLREASAAARLHHTNIVPVFEVGQDKDFVFYAMQLIQGQGLDDVIRDLRSFKQDAMRRNKPVALTSEQGLAESLLSGRFEQSSLLEEQRPPSGSDKFNSVVTEAIDTPRPMSETSSSTVAEHAVLDSSDDNRVKYFRSVAEIGLQTARALSYSHARGVIHRDIKPSNLLLDAAGVIWVTDFGLAKTSDSSMTHTGDILGTLRYMSPERFEGQCDVRADIYSLGMTLYELLLLKPAFDSSNRMKLIDKVMHAELPRPRSEDPRIPRDLETIVLKASERNAASRYQSADEFADDLQRFLKDEPIRARRASVIERTARWARRNKSISVLLTTLAIALLLMVYFLASSVQDQRERQISEEHSRFVSAVAITESERGTARDALTQLAGIRSQSSLHEFALPLLHYQIHHTSIVYENPQLADAAFGPNSTVVSLNTDGKVFYWGERRDRPLKTISLAKSAHIESADIRDARLSADGRSVVLACDNKQVYWFELPNDIYSESGEIETSESIPTKVTTLEYAINRIHFFDHGKQIVAEVTLDEDRFGAVIIRRNQATPQAIPFRVDTEDRNPLGPRIIAGRLQRLSAQAGGFGTVMAPMSVVNSDTLVVPNVPHATHLAVIKQGKLKLVFNRNEVRAAALSPDAKMVAAAASDGEIRFYPSSFGEYVDTGLAHSPHMGVVSILRFSPNGRWLATGGVDGVVTVYDMTVEMPSPTFHFGGHVGEITNLSFDATSQRLISTAADGQLRVWNLTYQPRGNPRTEVDQFVHDIRVSPNGQYFARAEFDGCVIGRLDPYIEFHKVADKVFACAFSPDSKQVAIGTDDAIVIWNVESGEADRIPNTGTIARIDFSPDGKYVATGDGVNTQLRKGKGCARVWNVSSKKQVYECPQDQLVGSVAFSPDGNWLATASRDDKEVVIHNVSSDNPNHWTAKKSIKMRGEVFCVQFSPDQNLLAIAEAGETNQISLLDVAHSNRPPRRMPKTDAPMLAIQFSRTGKQLIAGGFDGVVRVWDVERREELLRLDANNRITGLAFSADKNPVLLVSEDNAHHVWRTSLDSWATPKVAAVRLHEDLERISDSRTKQSIVNATTLHPETLRELVQLRRQDFLVRSAYVEQLTASGDNKRVSREAKALFREAHREWEELIADPTSSTPAQRQYIARVLAKRFAHRSAHEQLWELLTGSAMEVDGLKLLSPSQDTGFLVGGGREEYIFSLDCESSGLKSLRVEVLPVAGRPHQDAPFEIAEIEAFWFDEVRKEQQPVDLRYDDACSVFPPFQNAIDGAASSSWNCGDPHHGIQTAIYTCTPRKVATGKLRIRVTLDSSRAVRRIRFAASDRAIDYTHHGLRLVARNDSIDSCLRLAVEQYLFGEFESAAATLKAMKKNSFDVVLLNTLISHAMNGQRERFQPVLKPYNRDFSDCTPLEHYLLRQCYEKIDERSPNVAKTKAYEFQANRFVASLSATVPSEATAALVQERFRNAFIYPEQWYLAASIMKLFSEKTRVPINHTKQKLATLLAVAASQGEPRVREKARSEYARFCEAWLEELVSEETVQSHFDAAKCCLLLPDVNIELDGFLTVDDWSDLGPTEEEHCWRASAIALWLSRKGRYEAALDYTETAITTAGVTWDGLSPVAKSIAYAIKSIVLSKMGDRPAAIDAFVDAEQVLRGRVEIYRNGKIKGACIVDERNFHDPLTAGLLIRYAKSRIDEITN